jgi:glycosyltransferase involved in cell wall biosynthesis
MRLSYLMTAHNKEPFIAESISSFLAQDYKDKELIIMDDYSKDGTKEVCEFYQSKHRNIRYYRTTKNIGVANCRNLARSNATGNIICVLDADDVAYPQRSKTVNMFFHDNPEVDIMYGSANIIDVTGKTVASRNADRFSIDKMKKQNEIVHSTVAFRNKVKTLYRNDLRFIDDWYFYLDCYNDGYKFGYIDYPLGAWRMNPDGLSYINGGMMTKAKEKLKQKLINEFKDFDDDLTDVMEIPLQKARIKAILREIPVGSAVMDVGCNGGYLMEKIIDKGCDSCGIDIAPNLISICQLKHLDTSCSKAEDIAKKHDCFFDRIVYGDILEHYYKDKLKNILCNGIKALKNKGKLVITLPHKDNIFSTKFNTSHIANYDEKDIKDALPDYEVESKPIYFGDTAIPYWHLVTVTK